MVPDTNGHFLRDAPEQAHVGQPPWSVLGKGLAGSDRWQRKFEESQFVPIRVYKGQAIRGPGQGLPPRLKGHR
jgi:hypothetical protein